MDIPRSRKKPLSVAIAGTGAVLLAMVNANAPVLGPQPVAHLKKRMTQ